LKNKLHFTVCTAITELWLKKKKLSWEPNPGCLHWGIHITNQTTTVNWIETFLWSLWSNSQELVK
jgi:hypothetical protein